MTGGTFSLKDSVQTEAEKAHQFLQTLGIPDSNIIIERGSLDTHQNATFTKKLINTVGYFDEHQFKIRGHSHIDYTMRCCRMKLNNYKTLFDIKNSNNYIKLNDIHYTSSFFKLAIFLRELYKVDIYELERRNKILENNNRKFIGNDFVIK